MPTLFETLGFEDFSAPAAPPPAKPATLWERTKRGIGSTVNAAQIATAGQNDVAALVAEEARSQLPASPAALQMQEDIKPYVERANQAQGAGDNISAWSMLAAKRLGQFITNPREAASMIAESLPNSAPGMAGMLAGGMAGSTAGPVGAAAGSIAGGTAGGYVIENGAAMRDQIMKEAQARGIDARNPDALAPLIAEKYDEFLQAARMKGAGTAVTDAVLTRLTLGLAGMGERAIVKGAGATTAALKAGTKTAAEGAESLAALTAQQAARNTLPRKVARGAGVTGMEMAGEGASEAAGQLLAYGKADAGDVVDEGLLGFGQGALMAGTRGVYAKATGATETDAADNSLRQLGEAVQARQVPLPATTTEAAARVLDAESLEEATARSMAEVTKPQALEWNKRWEPEGGFSGAAPLYVFPDGSAASADEASTEIAKNTSIQNLEAWFARSPTAFSEERAAELADAAGKKAGAGMSVVPLPDGSGFTVVPSKWADTAALTDYLAEARGAFQAEQERRARVETAATAPVDRAPRTGSATPATIDTEGPNAVAQFIERQRATNTPQARAFVQDFEAGRITPSEVMARIMGSRPSAPSADELLAAAAAQAPKPGDGLLLTVDGFPYGTKTAATMRARKEGGSVVEVPGGFAVRKESASVEPFVPADAPVADRAADGAGNQPGGSGGTVGRVAADGRAGNGLGAQQQAPAERGGANESADGRGSDGTALTLARPVMTGKVPGTSDYGASAGSLSDGSRRQLMVDPDGGYFWGDWNEAAARDGSNPVVGKHAGFTPAKFTSSKEAREAAASTPQSKSEPANAPTPQAQEAPAAEAPAPRGTGAAAPAVVPGAGAADPQAGGLKQPDPTAIADAWDRMSPESRAGALQAAEVELNTPTGRASVEAKRIAAMPWKDLPKERQQRLTPMVALRLPKPTPNATPPVQAASGESPAAPEGVAPAKAPLKERLKAMGKKAPDPAALAEAWAAMSPESRAGALQAADVDLNTPTGRASVEAKRLAEQPWQSLPDALRAKLAPIVALRLPKAAAEPAPVATRETITPADDFVVGQNDAGEVLRERKDGSRYRMRFDRKDKPNGYPDFGGDLSPVTTAATHKDPGEPAEVVTPAVVAEAIKTAAKNEDMTRGQMKIEALRLVDMAIAKAPEKGDKKITISVPGDGAFTVVNNVARLKEFRKQIEASPGFKDKMPSYPIGKAVTSGNASPDALAREMLDDGEPVNALELLDATDQPMMFGNGIGSSVPYTNAEPMKMGAADVFVGRGWSTKKGKTSWWSVIHTASGLSVGDGGSKAEALAEAKKKLADPKNADRLARIEAQKHSDTDKIPFKTQAELREDFIKEAEGKQQATFDNADAMQARATAQREREQQRDDFYQSLMGNDAVRPTGATTNQWSAEKITALLDKADKSGMAPEALKFLDEVIGESNQYLQGAISKWRDAYDKRNKPQDTGWLRGFQAPGGYSRIRRDVKHIDGTTYRAELDERAGQYVTGKVEQWDEGNGRPRTIMTFSNEMDARERADKFLDSVAALRAAPAAPLYASRPVTNADAILAWAATQGFKSTLPAADLHVTVAYSKTPMRGASVPKAGDRVLVRGGDRTVEPLGSEGAVVLKFSNSDMQARWQQYRDAGASWDYEGYTPHVTITYDGKGVNLSKVEPYTGPIILGPETQAPLNVDKADDYKDKEVPTAAPAPAPAAEPAIPDGYRKVSEYFRDNVATPLYAPFAEGERVRVKDGGFRGSIIGFFGGPVTTKGLVKYDDGREGFVAWRDMEAEPAAAPEAAEQDDEPAQFTEAQARKQFEWRDLGQKDGLKTHMLFFFEKPEDKGTGRAMGRLQLTRYEGASGWQIDGEGQQYPSLADAKKAAIEVGIERTREQGWITAEPATPEAPAVPAGRTYLAVPFESKDYAKRAGAKWDADKKLWYADPITTGPASGEININLTQFIPTDYSGQSEYNFYGKDVASAVAANATLRTGVEHEARRRKTPDGGMSWSALPVGEDAAPDAAPAPLAKPAPKSFRKTHQVETQVFDESSGQFVQQTVDADSALKALDADISALQAFRKCITGG